MRVGDECGRKHSSGYREIGIGGSLQRAHRLAFIYMLGIDPPHFVDHINGIRDDNRWSNLRMATQSQNMANVGKQVDNTSGAPGVVWDRSRSKWRAQICVNGKKKNLGRYSEFDAAVEAYKAAARAAWGEFCRV